MKSLNPRGLGINKTTLCYVGTTYILLSIGYYTKMYPKHLLTTCVIHTIYHIIKNIICILHQNPNYSVHNRYIYTIQYLVKYKIMKIYKYTIYLWEANSTEYYILDSEWLFLQLTHIILRTYVNIEFKAP